MGDEVVAPGADGRIALPLRLAAASAVLGLGLIACVGLLVRGADLSFSFCLVGECDPPENAGVGGLMMLGGVLSAGVGLGFALWLNRERTSVVRSFLTFPAALATGAVLARLGVSNMGDGSGENVVLFAMVATAVAVAVPPLNWRWGLAAIAGAIAAGLFRDDPLPALPIAAVVFAAAVGVTSMGDQTA